MDYTNQLNKCRNFLRDHDTGIMASSTLDGHPHASVVNYFLNDDATEIYFIAREAAQKYKNITANPFACLVVCADNFASSVEVKGIAYLIPDGKKVNDLLVKFARIIRQKNPGPLPIMNSPGSELYLFSLKPQHMTYADFYRSSNNEGEYFELHV